MSAVKKIEQSKSLFRAQSVLPFKMRTLSDNFSDVEMN
jgi:hypothetical protein